MTRSKNCLKNDKAHVSKANVIVNRNLKCERKGRREIRIENKPRRCLLLNRKIEYPSVEELKKLERPSRPVCGFYND